MMHVEYDDFGEFVESEDWSRWRYQANRRMEMKILRGAFIAAFVAAVVYLYLRRN